MSRNSKDKSTTKSCSKILKLLLPLTPMETYLFALGRDPALSIAEIESYFTARNIQIKIVETGGHAIVLSTTILPTTIIKELGGTVTIGRVLSSERRTDRIEYSLDQEPLYTGTKNKITYSLTGFETDLDSFLKDYLKNRFKNEHLKALLKKEPTPTSLSQRQDHLDFVLFRSHISQTLFITQPQELKQRDLQRPAVDHKKTISLRLAKILLILSEAKEDSVFLDPFCGNGTILQEALLLGCRPIGIESDQESFHNARLNLDWATRTYRPRHSYKLYYSDARHLTEKIKISSIDSVATEPYLGPYLRKLPSIEEAKNTVKELTSLYLKVLQQLSQVVKRGKKVIIIIPKFKTKEGKTVFINFRDLAEDTTFDIECSFPYASKENKLLREIYVLRKN